MSTGSERREQSVLTALDELRRIEEERQQTERREAERARAAEAEAARRAKEAEAAAARQAAEAEAHRRRVSEHEARLRVDADLEARDAEAERRIAALRAELARVQAAREAEHLQRLAHLEVPQRAPARGRGFVSAMLGSGFGALVVALGFTFFASDPAAHTPIAATEAAPRVEPAAAETVATPAPEAAPEAASVEATPTIVAPRPPRERVRPSSPRGERPARPARGLDLVERCGDDPLCAIDGPRR